VASLRITTDERHSAAGVGRSAYREITEAPAPQQEEARNRLTRAASAEMSISEGS
jgi:hypothetical protein